MAYLKTKIYLLRLIGDDTISYVGHTKMNLEHRLSSHKSHSRYGKSLLYETMREFGADSFEIILIEDYPCYTREQACIEEERCRSKLLTILNTYKCYRSKQYIAQYKRDKVAEYYIDNKNAILEKRRIYYLANRMKILERIKQRRREKNNQ